MSVTLQKVTAKTRNQKPMHWSALLCTSLKRPPHAAWWSACRDFLQLLRVEVTAPMPPCRASNLFAPCKTSSMRASHKALGARHPSWNPSRSSGIFALSATRHPVQSTCSLGVPGSMFLSSVVSDDRDIVYCWLALRPRAGANSVCRGSSRSVMSLASNSFRVLLTLIIALPLSRKRSESFFLQKLGMNDAMRARSDTSNIGKQLRSQCL